MTTDYAPSFKACRLYEKTSQRGQMYLVGRMGGVKIAIVKSKETTDDGQPIWSLLYSEAPQREPITAREPDSAPAPRSKASPMTPVVWCVALEPGGAVEGLDDEISDDYKKRLF